MPTSMEYDVFCLSRALARCSTGMAPRRLAAASPWIGNDCIAPNQEARPPPTPWSGREPFSDEMKQKHMKFTAISMNHEFDAKLQNILQQY